MICCDVQTGPWVRLLDGRGRRELQRGVERTARCVVATGRGPDRGDRDGPVAEPAGHAPVLGAHPALCLDDRLKVDIGGLPREPVLAAARGLVCPTAWGRGAG